MAHKRKINQPPLSDAQKQNRKTKYYQFLEEIMTELKGERQKENTYRTQIRELKVMLLATRESISRARKSNIVPMRNSKSGWFETFKTLDEALEVMIKDQSNIEKNIEAIKTQLKLAVEKQNEHRKHMIKHLQDKWLDYFGTT